MANFNNVVLLGNLVADPETKDLNENSSVTKFRMAVNRKYTTKSGEKKDDTIYIDCELWGARGKALQKYTSKGEAVLVNGFLKQESWQTKEGENRSKFVVSVQDFEFISSKDSNKSVSKNTKQEASISSDDVPF